jgi:opacity protein-like surface antigen
MRMIIAAVLASGLFAGAASAQAVGGSYVAVSGGFVGESDYDYATPGGFGFSAGRVQADIDSGFAGQVAWGRRYSENVRLEAALSYRSQDIASRIVLSAPSSTFQLDGDKASAIVLDFNGYYDLPVSGPVRPYVGAGLGLAQVNLDDGIIDDSASTLNLQAMAGVSVAAGDKATFFLEARYQRLGTIEVETTVGGSTVASEFDLSGPAAYAGVRFSF